MKSWKDILSSVMRDGGPSTCQFAITNVCNAACDFCNFSRDKLERKHSRWVSLEDGLRSLEVLRGQDVGFMVFTGGEPTVHPHWTDFLKESDRLGMVNLMVSNGSTLSERTVENFHRSALSGIIISIDSQDLVAHEQNRGLKGVCEKIQKTIPLMKQAGIGATASVTLNRLLDDFDRLPDTLRELGFEAVTFSFPLTDLESSYLGAANSDLVTFTREEMHEWIERVEKMKSRFPVLNPRASLEDMHAHLESAPKSSLALVDGNSITWTGISFFGAATVGANPCVTSSSLTAVREFAMGVNLAWWTVFETLRFSSMWRFRFLTESVLSRTARSGRPSSTFLTSEIYSLSVRPWRICSGSSECEAESPSQPLMVRSGDLAA